MADFPNKARNDEVAKILAALKDLGLGAQIEAHTGHANALASLDVAEWLQLLHLQLAESTKQNAISLAESTKQNVAALHETTGKLIESNTSLAGSNDRHATSMQWLTAALVLVGIAQIVIAWLTH